MPTRVIAGFFLVLALIFVGGQVVQAKTVSARGLTIGLWSATPRLYTNTPAQHPVKIGLEGYVDGAVSVYVMDDNDASISYPVDGKPGNKPFRAVLNTGLLASNPITVSYDGAGMLTLTAAKGWLYEQPEEQKCFILCW